MPSEIQTTKPWTDGLGANIQELPDALIEKAVTKWAAEHDTDWIVEDLELDQSKIMAGISKALATQILMARVKEFHAVEVEADVLGLKLWSEWMSDADFGSYTGDQVTAHRVLPYVGLLEDLVDDIMRPDDDVVPKYQERHRQGLRDLRTFATLVLKALDESPFTGV